MFNTPHVPTSRRLKEAIENVIPLPDVDAAATRAAEIMSSLVLEKLDGLERMKQAVNSAEVSLERAKAAMSTSSTCGTSQQQSKRPSRGTRVDYAQIHFGSSAASDAPVTGVVPTSQSAYDEACAELAHQEAEFVEWKKQNYPLSKEDFISHANNCVKPGYEYFMKLFSEGGEMYPFFNALYGATVFNPMVLSKVNPQNLMLRLDELKNFGFKEFTDEFIQKLKDLLPSVIDASKKRFDWSAVDGALEYDLELVRKGKLDADMDCKSARELVIEKWRDDPLEKARRIFEWWRARYDRMPTWVHAVRLVALVQTSSAFVERVFSRMKLIIQTIGESSLEDTIESRLFVALNKCIACPFNLAED